MKKNYLAIDLGGTNTKLGVGDLTDGLKFRVSIPTKSEDGPISWVQRLKGAIESEDFKKFQIQGIGVGAPGPLDVNTGTILVTPNIKTFEGFNMKSELFQALGIRPVFENDANTAALGEYYFGDCKGQENLVIFTLGTGLGSGVICNGQLVRGARGFASEMGHIIIDRNQDLESIREKGMSEKYIGAKSCIEKFNREFLSSEKPRTTCMEDLFELIESGDEAAKNFLKLWSRDLSIIIHNAAVIFNPSSIVFSGGVAKGWNHFKNNLINDLESYLPEPFYDGLKIQPSSLGTVAGLYGGLALAAGK